MPCPDARPSCSIEADPLCYGASSSTGSDIGLASPILTAMATSTAASSGGVGIILEAYYTNAECSPSRSAVLTGFFASSTGMQVR